MVSEEDERHDSPDRQSDDGASKLSLLHGIDGSPPTPPVPPALPANPVSPIPENLAWLDRVRQNRGAQRDAFARSHGVASAEYEQQVADHLKQLLENAKIFHRVQDSDALKGILRDGHFKTQFETNTSGGLLDTTARTTTEKSLWGYPASLNPRIRPIYGYLHYDPNGLPVHEEADAYGDISVRFKPEIRHQSSFTSGDSLEVSGTGQIPAIAPKPVDTPGWEALNDWTGDALPFRTLREWVTHAIGKDGIKYIEAQIHAGVPASMIEEILFHYDEPDEELKNLISKHGIPWKMVH